MKQQKNIWLLSTDKPSRLAGSEYITNEQGIDKRTFKLKLWNKIIDNKDLKDVGYIPQHIYITNDEEIEEGDWVYCTTDKDIDIANDRTNYYRNKFRKIILTTDQDLIKDGVQAIDNEFLEWFCSKNRGVDFVEVIQIKDEKN